MKAIGHIYVDDKGLFSIAAHLEPVDLVQVLLSLASTVVKQNLDAKPPGDVPALVIHADEAQAPPTPEA